MNSPSLQDPRWVNWTERKPESSEYPIFWYRKWASSRVVWRNERPCIFKDEHELFWISEKVAETPIPFDLFQPKLGQYVCAFTPAVPGLPDPFGYNGKWTFWTWCDEVRMRLPNPTHWFPLGPVDEDASILPREPWFPSGEPPKGYRFLGEGELPTAGDRVWIRGDNLFGFVVSPGRSPLPRVKSYDDSYSEDRPWVRPLPGQAAAPAGEPASGLCAPSVSFSVGSSALKHLAPPPSAALTERVLEEKLEPLFDRIQALETKLDRLLAHLGAGSTSSTS